jgi:LysM repeat protein
VGQHSLTVSLPAICGSTTFTNYTVVSGDTLTTIAQQFNSGICDIATANSLADPNLIFPGEVLTIPADCVTPDNTSCIKPTYPPSTCVLGVGSTYVVRSGDTLSAIAGNFNITLEALEGANPQITNPDLITVGQLINTPICPDSTCQVGPYVIQSGDTFFALGQEYGSTIGQIESLNQGVDPTTLQPGQTIILPEACANVTSATA